MLSQGLVFASNEAYNDDMGDGKLNSWVPFAALGLPPLP